MYESDVALRYRTNFEIDTELHLYIGKRTEILEKHNPYVEKYKELENVVEEIQDEYTLYFTRGLDKRIYIKPVTFEYAAIIVLKDGIVPDFDLSVYPKSSNEDERLPNYQNI